ncbi:MAG: DUF378 domain-containing protein [Oscillospiraceae bacterium]|jgi:uncharacterized membrane protein YuzA (DUF378 family)|nr:DUF378 domain-containing protein [Oscillospiraceae bacterium]
MLAVTILGALNWACVGLFHFDIVASLFGGATLPPSRITYTLIGLAGLSCLPLLFRRQEPAEELL